MNDIVARDEKIASKIDAEVAGTLAVSNSAGGISFANAGQIMEFAKMLAISNVAVPKHLRGNPGACLGIVTQAVEWRMSPFAVANKSYSVNDRLAYEAQLIHAVVLQRAPLDGRIKFEFRGEGATRSCRTWAKIKNSDETVEYCSPRLADIKTKNSPLWVADPDQQLGYYSVRALCRRHFPDVLMGVYSRDELDDSPRIGPEVAKDVTPRKSLAEKLTAIAGSRQAPEAIAGETPGHDPETGEIREPEAIEDMDTGKLAARRGQASFDKWWKTLVAPDAERAEPYMDEFHEAMAEWAAQHG